MVYCRNTGFTVDDDSAAKSDSCSNFRLHWKIKGTYAQYGVLVCITRNVLGERGGIFVLWMTILQQSDSCSNFRLHWKIKGTCAQYGVLVCKG